jgi:hypothetical protein
MDNATASAKGAENGATDIVGDENVVELADIFSGSGSGVVTDAVSRAMDNPGKGALVARATGKEATLLRSQVVAELARRGLSAGGRNRAGDAIAVSRKGHLFVVVAGEGSQIDLAGLVTAKAPS